MSFLMPAFYVLMLAAGRLKSALGDLARLTAA